MSLSTCFDLHPVFGDIEASGLDEASYPIEIGWSLPDGRTRSFLIKPEPEWTHWDEAAEDLHGISREELEKSGLPPDAFSLLSRNISMKRLRMRCGEWD